MGFVAVSNDEKFRKLLEDIFTDEFMQKNTRFRSFEGFRYSGAVIANWNADPMVYNEDLLDRFVRESTDFDSWNEMVCAAADQRFSAAN